MARGRKAGGSTLGKWYNTEKLNDARRTHGDVHYRLMLDATVHMLNCINEGGSVDDVCAWVRCIAGWEADVPAEIKFDPSGRIPLSDKKAA